VQQSSRGQQPQLSVQEPLSSWKSYEGPGQRGLASGFEVQELVGADQQLPSVSEARRDQWTVPAMSRPGPHWTESDRRSQPQLNVTKQPATYSSHPELSGGHQFVELTTDTTPFTSTDLLRRAQPGGQSVTSPTPFTHPAHTSTGVGVADRRSVPVGGHLRAIDPKSMQQVAPAMLRSTSEHGRPQSYHSQPSQAPAISADSEYAKPDDRSSRAARPVSGAWERAKKEEELKHFELEQKRRRDDEIRQLETRLPDRLNPAEIDRLRRLKLNAEFDRRATEHGGDLPADTNIDMTPAVSHFRFIRCFVKRNCSSLNL